MVTVIGAGIGFFIGFVVACLLILRLQGPETKPQGNDQVSA